MNSIKFRILRQRGIYLSIICVITAIAIFNASFTGPIGVSASPYRRRASELLFVVR